MTNVKSSGLQVIDERNWGVLVWMMPDRSFVQDDEGHFLSLPSAKGDQRRKQIMREFVYKNFGIEHGQPVWISNRQVSDEEFDYQKARMEWGLTPDPLDDVQEGIRNGSIKR